MEYQEDMYDLFFEISSLERHKILLLLQKETANLTQLSNKVGLNLPETRRHISRLVNVDLVERIPNGSYSLTTFGQQILETVEEIAFVSHYKNYFLRHSVTGIPREFQVKLRDLAISEYHDNVLNFIRRMEDVIRKAEKHVLLLVDQFPLNHLSLIMESIERGVHFRIIEPKDRVLNPDFDALAPQESLTLDKMKMTSQVEQRMMDKVNILLVVSETDAVVAFPTTEGEYDYKGFRAKNTTFQDWCGELFNHYWSRASQRLETTAVTEHVDKPLEESTQIPGKIILTGSERPELDAQAIQDAVDRYDEVVLKGRFNIGASTIGINKNLIIRGEGRTNDIPDTKILKKGWSFPFLNQEFMFDIRGEDIDVTIENLHVENFNGTCINTCQGNSITIRRNRITLLSGLGRGLSFGSWGDYVVGITSGGESPFRGSSPGGVLIEENYLDFALSYARGGFITKDGKERDPAFRPDLRNHESSICIGILINRNLGKVIVRNNVIRNMNSRGILVADNWETADIHIHDNQISSNVFGSYPFNSPISGVGIFVQSAWAEPRKGGRVRVYNNKILLDKVNYCGIAVHGPSMYGEGAGKLEECFVEGNEITLNDGLYGIQVRKSDNVKITENKFSGKSYYGLQINGSRSRENIELGSNNIRFNDNNLSDLEIKPTDDYSDKHVGDYVFNGVDNKSRTAQVWLNKYSSQNTIKLLPSESFINEGTENKVELSDLIE